MAEPQGTIVHYDGQRYLVTAAGDVYVWASKGGGNWRWHILPHDGPRAAAIRYQLKRGYTS